MRNSKGQFIKGNQINLGRKRPEWVMVKIRKTFFKKGQIAWNKGISHTEETRKKMSLKRIGKIDSEETKKRKSNAMKGRINYWLIGNKNRWKGGITPENKIIRNSYEYKDWRKKVFEKEDYACWICEERGIYIEAHHLKLFSEFPELRFDVNNGIALCRYCHITYTKFRNNNLV